jgi:hypothetical protein
VRTSTLRNISLRHNRINQTGAVALALMIRDYPDVVNAPSASAPASPSPSFAPFTPAVPTPPLPEPSVKPLLGPNGKPLPPPRHPASTITAAQTTYTPYVPRRRQQSANSPVAAAAAPAGRPVVASSVLGGVTARHMGEEVGGNAREKEKEREREAKEREREAHAQGPSAALLDKVRALDALPRLGALRTLDLRGNDLRVRFWGLFV